MKRLSCLLVALLLVIVAVFCTSCGEEEELLEFIDAVQAYEVKRVVCDIEMITWGGAVLNARSAWSQDAGSVTYEVFNELSSDSLDEMTSSKQVAPENGTNIILLSDLEFSTLYLSSYEVKDGVLTCVVNSPDDFFGRELNTDTVDFSITMIGSVLTGATISYETDEGMLVLIEARFL